MQRFLLVTVATAAFCLPSTGCMSRAIKEGIGVATGASGKVVEVQRVTNLSRYKGFTVDSLTAAPGLKMPAEVPAMIRQHFNEVAAKRDLKPNGVPALKLVGEVIHYESAGAVDTAIGPLEEVIVRTKLIDTESGQVLTEGTAVLQYIADRNPSSGLAPPAGDLQRYRLLEWLGYINSEIHKNFSPFFNPAATAQMKEMAKANLQRRLSFAEQALGDRPYLLGERFTVADAYLFVILGWGQPAGVDIGQWPGLKALHARVGARPKVQAAMKAEGLVK